MTLISFRDRLHAAPACQKTLSHGFTGFLFLCLTAAMPVTASPDWAVPYGGEFWKTPPHSPGFTLLSAHGPAATNAVGTRFGAAIERVQNAFAIDGPTRQWTVPGRRSGATLSPEGLQFRKLAGAGEPAPSIRTIGVHTGASDGQGDPQKPLEWSDWCVTGNTAQRHSRDPVPVVEHLESLVKGVEVTWIIGQAPCSPADLVIDWEITGRKDAEESERRWRLPGQNGRPAILVGEVMAVDSSGRRLPLTMDRAGGVFSIVVPAAFLRSATYPVAIDPLISVEFDLDQPVAAPAPSAQFSPAIASDGTNYLVVWHDNRNGANLDLYAARVTTNGTVLDPSGFAITTATNDQWFPAVAYNGTNYLVAWQDARSGAQDIYAARVTSDGVVLETNGLPVVTASNDQRLPAVASGGGGFLVTWQDGRNGAANQDVYAARITGAGLLVETNGFVVSNSGNSQSAPAVGVVGTNYVVAWHDFRSGVSLDVYAARITQAGTVLDANGILVSAAANDQWNVAVAGNGTTGLLTWQDGRNGTDDDIYAARINESGTVLDPGGFAVSQQPNQQRSPAVRAFGTGFYIVWQDNGSGSDFDVHGASVSAAGIVNPVGGTSISNAPNDQRYPAIAAAGDQLLVVWEDIRNGLNTDIVGSRIDGAGTPLDAGGLVVSTVSNAQEAPAVAGNGTLYLAVWRDFRNDPLGDIYGSRITADGIALDPAGLAICTAGNYQLAPQVAASGADFLVVWQDFRNGVHDDIIGSRVTGSGLVLDPSGLLITTAVGAQRFPAVAGTTNGYFVVWQDHRSGTGDDIYGTRVGIDGGVGDPGGLPVCLAGGDQKAPAVAGLNDSCFVVWQDFRGGVSNRIYGTRIRSGGVVDVPDGFALSSIPGEQVAPRIAASTNQFLAVWQGQTNSDGFNIFGTRISQGGIVQDTNSIMINAVSGDQTHPVVAAKQGDFMVVWEDQRVAGRTNLYASRLTANGSVLEATGEMTAPDTGTERVPAIANIGSDYLLVYQTFDRGRIARARGVLQHPASQPTISLSPGAAQFVAGSGGVPIDAEATLVDAASANFEGGTLTVDLTANATANDRLGIRHVGMGAGQIGFNGNQVSYGGVLIGFTSGGTSGSSPLFIIFSSAATAEAVEALARNVTFNNVVSLPFTQPRTARFALNLAGGSGQPATRTVNVIDAGSVPLIVTQPVSQSTGAGGSVTLSVTASGSQPLRYQWRLNGQDIAGATNATYSISALQSATAGAYTVVVSNAYDTIISETATITYFDIAMYAGLTLAGPVGSVYRVEYRPAIGDATTWLTLTNVTLGSGPMLFFDPDSSLQNQRFYRAILETTP